MVELLNHDLLNVSGGHSQVMCTCCFDIYRACFIHDSCAQCGTKWCDPVGWKLCACDCIPDKNGTFVLPKSKEIIKN